MNLDDALTSLARDPATPLDLAELALCLAQDEYPDLDVEAYLSELDGMAREARNYLGGNLNSQVHGLCRYLFHEMGFRGNLKEYYDVRNSYLNEVLDRRKGIPISLATVAIAVGNRAGLEIVGVGLPGHFVAKAISNGDEVVFDPFHGGRPLQPHECENLVEQVTGSPFEATPDALQATPTGLVVLRMLGNLKGVYLRDGDFTRAIRVIERMRQLSPNDILQRRDLGLSLLQSGQPGPAIDHLAAYLAAAPTNEETADVKKMLDKAKAEVALWN